jgi:uncharacterized protein
MKVAVTGSSGLIGSALCTYITQKGHEVLRIVRKKTSTAQDIFWNTENGKLEEEKLEGVDAIVHLAGESIASSRWTEAQKAKIRSSRIDGTKQLADAISKLAKPPKVVVSGSAIGFYGDRGNEDLTEQSQPGKGFLADVCREWEQSISPIRSKGVRIVNLRTGVILSTKSGALQKMLPIFKLGGGGNIGSGRQYISWISLDDEVMAIWHIINTDSIVGPVNCVAPNPVTNQEFTQVLGKVIHRPTVIPLPEFAARIIMGEMADELLLASQRCLPKSLLNSGYSFQYPNLEQALQHELGTGEKQ